MCWGTQKEMRAKINYNSSEKDEQKNKEQAMRYC